MTCLEWSLHTTATDSRGETERGSMLAIDARVSEDQYTYSDSLRAARRLTERQLVNVLHDHSLTFTEWNEDSNTTRHAYNATTNTYDAGLVADWLGY